MTGERVLLVDDSDVLRKLLAGLLAEHGFVPVEAESAEQALRVALTDPPDIAIVDQHLPGLSGAHLVQQLRASGAERLRTLPVIGLSGRVWAERDLMAAGACCFVRKPVEVPALVHALRWALEVYRPPIAAG